MIDVRLGRIPSPTLGGTHPLDFLMAYTAPPPTVTHRFWTPGPVLDQGQTPECVGCGLEGLMNASPVRQKPPHCLSWDGIYKAAQLKDGMPLPHDGTTVRAGVEVLYKAGNIASYHFGLSFDDIWTWLLTMGPVVIGVNWYESMMVTDNYGFLNIGGDVAGGHCVFLDGGSIAKIKGKRCTRGRNSWGTDWGLCGSFWLTEDALSRLLAEQGEAVAAIEKAA